MKKQTGAILKKSSDILQKRKQQTVEVYKRYESFVPLLTFSFGFTIDTFTLSVVNIVDHLTLLFYTIFAGGIILLTGMLQTGQISHPKLLKFEKWYPVALQFFVGSLFSAYFVYYFKSASVNQSVIFLGLLLFLLVANELLGNKLSNLALLSTLYFFTTFAFLTFFIPVLMKSIAPWMFYVSGAISFLLTGGILAFVFRKIVKQHVKKIIAPAIAVSAAFLTMILLYRMNYIPPVPLSLKESGVFHSISVDYDGEHMYKVAYHKKYPFMFWVNDDKTFYYSEGDVVHCYASVFAPPGWKEKIDFRWQYYDEQQKKYVTTDLLGYDINYVPGRQAGYRGRTQKRNVRPGDWRIDVEINTGDLRRVLGRIDFEIIPFEGEEKDKGKRIVERR